MLSGLSHAGEVNGNLIALRWKIAAYHVTTSNRDVIVSCVGLFVCKKSRADAANMQDSICLAAYRISGEDTEYHSDEVVSNTHRAHNRIVYNCCCANTTPGRSEAITNES